jgi:hypothetical protein
MSDRGSDGTRFDNECYENKWRGLRHLRRSSHARKILNLMEHAQRYMLSL